MADLSGYAPIYIRTTGNDNTGDGSLNNPYATAQKGFEVAYNGTGNKVLDFGVGNFSGITLNTEWPSRIAIRGASTTQSFLGGINANGSEEIFDFELYQIAVGASNGYNINIISNHSINLGNISSNGGNGYNPAGGGTIILTDVKAEDISSVGGGGYDWHGGNGGLITINGSNVNDINTSGNNGPANGGSAGDINITSSSALNIISNGGSGLNGGGSGGDVTTTNSIISSISCAGGSFYYFENTNNEGLTRQNVGGSITQSGNIECAISILGASSINSSGLIRDKGINRSPILGLVQ